MGLFYFYLLCFLGTAAALGESYTELETVPELILDKYLGRWYMVGEFFLTVGTYEGPCSFPCTIV